MFRVYFQQVILFLSLLGCGIHLNGQDTIQQERFIFQGKLIGHQDSLPVIFGHVFNESDRNSVITDTSGIFKIKVHSTDTLVVNAVGYYPKVIFISKPAGSNQDSVISMQQRLYEIAEVQVTALGSYRQFKENVLNLELTDTPEDRLRKDMTGYAYQAAKDIKRQPSVAEQHNPIPEGIGVATIYTPYEKQLKNYNDFMKKETKRKVIYAKYNKSLIRDITKLEEPELTEFYAWLDLEEDWLIEASEYDIGEQVKNKYALYLAEKKDESP